MGSARSTPARRCAPGRRPQRLSHAEPQVRRTSPIAPARPSAGKGIVIVRRRRLRWSTSPIRLSLAVESCALHAAIDGGHRRGPGDGGHRPRDPGEWRPPRSGGWRHRRTRTTRGMAARPEGPAERNDPEPIGGYGPPSELRKLGTTSEAGKELQLGARAPSAALKQVRPLRKPLPQSRGRCSRTAHRGGSRHRPGMWIGGLTPHPVPLLRSSPAYVPRP